MIILIWMSGRKLSGGISRRIWRPRPLVKDVEVVPVSRSDSSMDFPSPAAHMAIHNLLQGYYLVAAVVAVDDRWASKLLWVSDTTGSFYRKASSPTAIRQSWEAAQYYLLYL
jgi:hypothetical protein